ncbi:MAG: Uma2 family endonuclease [Saprospiraceae bacterium]|nr:Uma2 family endonuclease [Saprospiraceae bacterium]
MTLVAERLITVSEFLERDDFEEGYIYELINGTIMKRASPNAEHQNAVLNIAAIMRAYVLEKNLGKCYIAPLDVVFDNFDLVQPDVLFIAKERLNIVSKFIEGAPDLVVEVLSQGTVKMDRNEKLKTYRKNGVSEYWIVDYKKKSIEIYALKDGDYDMVSYGDETGEVESVLLEGLKVNIEAIFE